MRSEVSEADRNSETFKSIFQTNKDRVYNFALRMLDDPDRAADITQDVFIRFFEMLRDQRTIDNPVAWLIVSARNLCLNALRTSRITRLLNDLDEPVTINSVPESDQTRLVRLALRELEVSDREILVLREYERFSYDDISKMLNISIPAVRSRLYKARLALRGKFLSLSITRN